MEDKYSSVLHHVEVCVQDEIKFLKLFTTGFGFRLSYFRSSVASQWVLQSGNSIFVVTKHLSNTRNVVSPHECNGHGTQESINLSNENGVNDGNETDSNDTYAPDTYPYLFCDCVRKAHMLDTAFNVALEVKNVDKICDNIKEYGGRVIKEPYTVKDEDGSLRLAVVESKCENVIHSLIDKSQYSGDFLPGFLKIDRFKNDKLFTENNYDLNTLQDNKEPLTDFIDHISIVCRDGESKGIVDWFQKCFNMQRFLSNSQDTVEDGFVLEDMIGLRLKALQYWRCAETGITPGFNLNDPRVLKLVIAEPLPNIENGQIKSFLLENRGPGVQHIALHCNNIISVIDEMKQGGVNFRMPPSTYYDEITKLNEILEINLKKSYEEFCKSGVLLDVEEDLLSKEESNRYLLQIFTFPIFEKDTFFMEVIQRYGATGFGAGNIYALARSIVRYQEELKHKTKNL